MSTIHRQTISDDVAGKVLRRAEVAKIARKLQDRLSLARYKAQNGQEDISFKDMEARLDQKVMQQKKASLSAATSSTSSSSSSEYPLFSGGPLCSPLTAPFPSEDTNSSRMSRSFGKRDTYQSTDGDRSEVTLRKRIRFQSRLPSHENSRVSWKSIHHLPESSPVHHRYHHQYFESQFSSSQVPNVSFASAISTVPTSPPFGHVSEEEDRDLPTKSLPMSQISNSSPPCTPPVRSHAIRHRKSNKVGEEGADLLLYLATSPSPANAAARSSRIFAPSTPPSKSQALSSPLMTTPGMTSFNTPGQQFNFADFVNITPSPAQGAFGNRTPGLAKTPLAAKEARRRLNFDVLVPPGGSPNASNIGRGPVTKDSGLGMELGGELVS